MELTWIGFGAFFCVSSWVGARLVWLAARGQGGVPALLIGVAVLGIGPVGFGLQVGALVFEHTGAAEGLATAAAVAVAIGLWSKLIFNWSVYRERSRVALAAAALLGLAVAALLLYQPMVGSFLEAVKNLDVVLARGALQVIALGWGAAEALLYWAQLRRRLRLGLADPVVANRMLLWGISAAAAGLGTAVGTIYSAVTGTASLGNPVILASSSAHGLIAAIAMWLAFVPPRSYVRWLNRSPAAA